MIRLTLLWVIVSFFSLYAFRDWFKSLCLLILLVGVVEHPDMPKTVFGIQGMNPWNLLLFFVLLGWLSSKKEEGLKWDMPRPITLMLIFYIAIMLISFFRMMGDLSGINEWFLETQGSTPSKLGLIAEHLINTVKWIIPGLLIYHGANSEKRIIYAIIATLAIYLILALQIIKAMPLGVLADGEQLRHYSLKILSRNVGFHRVNLAMMMAGAFWAVYAFKDYRNNNSFKLFIYSLCLIILLGLALTGGRTGYATLLIIGLVLSFYKWRRNLIFFPAVLVLFISFFPGSAERFTQGFDQDSRDATSESVEEATENQTGDIHYYTVTAGRSVIWPFVLDEIKKSPFLGYGKEAMQRNGISLWLLDTFGEVFPHPHNAYMQWILDNGVLGILPIALFYIYILIYSKRMFLADNKLTSAIGGAAFSLVLALLIAGFGSQTFYPREGAVPMWCMIGIMIRVYMDYYQNNNDVTECGVKSRPTNKFFT